MKLYEVDHYLYIEFEPHDWRTFAKRMIADLKKVSGKLYIPQTKCWRIDKSQQHLLGAYLPPFSIEEELEGERQLTTFLVQFDSDNANRF